MDNLGNLGERIKYIRKEKKLTQKKFAEKLGISQTHISKIEKGIENPSETLIRFISYLYCIDYEWLKTGNGTPRLKTGCDTDGTINKYYLFREKFEKPMEEYMTSDILWEYVDAYMHFSHILTAPSLETQKYKWNVNTYTSYYKHISKIMAFISFSVENTFEDIVENKYATETDIMKNKIKSIERLDVIKREYLELIESILKFEKNNK